MFSAGPSFNSTNHAGVTNNVHGDFYMLSEDKADKIYRWLDAPDSSGNFLAAREMHHDQTGTWFIEGEEYLRWKETPNSALWVYGTPGCGKTIICSTVIEKIRRECAADPSSACAYFFFDSRNAQTDLALHNRLIRSIIKQLSHQSSGFPASLVELYGGGQEQPSIQSLQCTLQKIIDGFKRAYIIIDAVDECTDRQKVLAWIGELTQRKIGSLRVLFSSRPERDIKDQLRSVVSLTRVTLNGKLADNDIETYLNAMLSKLIRWDKATIALVKDALLARSDGMFRWVALQISELFKCRTRRAVDDQLRNLPKDLEGMYERSLLNSPHRQDLKRFLMWLAFSARPLEPEELADVVTIDFTSNGLPSYDPGLRYFGPADMFLTCSSFLVEVEVEVKVKFFLEKKLISVIKLAHMSVKDYLVSDRLKNGPASYFSISAKLAHSVITKTCLAYLFHLRTLTTRYADVLESVPLGGYAAKYWIKHMQLGGGEDEQLSQTMHCIFSLEESALATWADLDKGSLWGYTEKIAAPLYYACIRDLERMTQELLIGEADVNAAGGEHGMRYATWLKDHDATGLSMFKYGQSKIEQGGKRGALQVALSSGHGAIIRLLLDHGADVNMQGGQYGNAVQAAWERGQISIAHLLFDHGADVNMTEAFAASVSLGLRALEEYPEEDESDSGEAEGSEEKADEDADSAKVEGDDSSAGDSSEDAWASAQEAL